MLSSLRADEHDVNIVTVPVIALKRLSASFADAFHTAEKLIQAVKKTLPADTVKV